MNSLYTYIFYLNLLRVLFLDSLTYSSMVCLLLTDLFPLLNFLRFIPGLICVVESKVYWILLPIRYNTKPDALHKHLSDSPVIGGPRNILCGVRYIHKTGFYRYCVGMVFKTR